MSTRCLGLLIALAAFSFAQTPPAAPAAGQPPAVAPEAPAPKPKAPKSIVKIQVSSDATFRQRRVCFASSRVRGFCST